MIDYARLHAVERSFAIRRAAQLEDRPVSGSFDLPHLRAIHGFLFQDVFPWAGGFRVVNMSKGGSFYLGEINAIHPFREGNGRTQREFIRQLALRAGHPLSWVGFTQQQMVDASIASHLRGDNAGLTAIIEAALFSSREQASRT